MSHSVRSSISASVNLFNSTYLIPKTALGWPAAAKTLENLPKEGKKNVLAICPGFSSDCVETLEEILIQGKESFLDSGGENFDMVPCLNDNDDHITLLRSLIQKSL